MKTSVENNSLSFIDDKNNENVSIIDSNERLLIKTDRPVNFSGIIVNNGGDSTDLISCGLLLNNKPVYGSILDIKKIYQETNVTKIGCDAFYVLCTVKPYVFIRDINESDDDSVKNELLLNKVADYGVFISLIIPEIDGRFLNSFVEIYLFGQNGNMLFHKKITGDSKKDFQKYEKLIDYKRHYYIVNGDYKDYEGGCITETRTECQTIYISILKDYRTRAEDFCKKGYKYTLKTVCSGENINESIEKNFEITTPIISTFDKTIIEVANSNVTYTRDIEVNQTKVLAIARAKDIVKTKE